MSSQANTEVIDPMEIMLGILSEELDSSFSRIDETIRIFLNTVFSNDDFFMDAFAKVFDDKEKLRLIIRRFINYSMPKIIAVLSLARDSKHPVVERLRDMYIYEVIHSSLTRAFVEELYLNSQ